MAQAIGIGQRPDEFGAAKGQAVDIRIYLKEHPAVIEPREQRRLVDDLTGLSRFDLIEQFVGVVRMKSNATVSAKAVNRLEACWWRARPGCPVTAR